VLPGPPGSFFLPVLIGAARIALARTRFDTISFDTINFTTNKK
jgi:hypothetical protein